MVERDVNPLAGRHRALSVRFKAAWAFHQLLVGMQRTRILEHFDDRSEAFKSAVETLKKASEQLEGPATSDSSVVPALLEDLESEVRVLEVGLAKTEEAISPSQVRRFFQQVRSFDERILLDIIRFYQRVEGTGVWDRDRLDKTDLVVSRLAESIAGPELQGDRTRLRKVLQALAVADSQAGSEETAEITSLSATLQDLRSEVRWVKTFDELHESKLVQLYRALKHDMGHKLFHPNLLPLVADVNNAFKLKIDELRGLEEDRIVSGYRKLLQGPEKNVAGGPELDVALAGLQRQLNEFETRTKTENVRLDELAVLGRESQRRESAVPGSPQRSRNERRSEPDECRGGYPRPADTRDRSSSTEPRCCAAVLGRVDGGARWAGSGARPGRCQHPGSRLGVSARASGSRRLSCPW